MSIDSFVGPFWQPTAIFWRLGFCKIIQHILTHASWNGRGPSSDFIRPDFCDQISATIDTCPPLKQRARFLRFARNQIICGHAKRRIYRSRINVRSRRSITNSDQARSAADCSTSTHNRIVLLCLRRLSLKHKSMRVTEHGSIDNFAVSAAIIKIDIDLYARSCARDCQILTSFKKRIDSTGSR